METLGAGKCTHGAVLNLGLPNLINKPLAEQDTQVLKAETFSEGAEDCLGSPRLENRIPIFAGPSTEIELKQGRWLGLRKPSGRTRHVLLIGHR